MNICISYDPVIPSYIPNRNTKSTSTKTWTRTSIATLILIVKYKDIQMQTKAEWVGCGILHCEN